MPDPRTEIKNCDICANDVFRESWKDTGVVRTALRPAKFQGQRRQQRQCGAGKGTADQEALIQAITDRVLAELSKRK